MSEPVVLDTHVVLDVAGARPIAPKAVKLLRTASHAGNLLVSAITIYELTTLARTGRIRTPKATSAALWVQRLVREAQLRVIPIGSEIAEEAALLTWPHGDPADRLIVATALSTNATLATRDEKILAFARSGGVKVIEA